MRFWRHLRLLLLAIASLGYFANGAQAHVKVSPGETLDLMMCTTGHAASIVIEIPGQPAEETPNTCCGDCASPHVIDIPRMMPIEAALLRAPATPSRRAVSVSPRSPLWPGAPPQGPPFSDKA